MSVKVTKMKRNQNNNKNSYFVSYQTRNSKKTSNSHISGSSGLKCPPGDQIQGFDASYPMDPIGTILTLVLAGNSKI